MKWALKPGHYQFYYSNGTATPTYNYGLSWIIMDNASSQVTNKRMQKMLKYLFCSKKQRCVGVEPTRDRAERPPSRFEDGCERLLVSSLDLFRPLLRRPEPNSFLSFCLDVATV